MRLDFNAPEYHLDLHPGGVVEVSHPLGIVVAYGHLPNGEPRVATQSVHEDGGLIGLIESFDPGDAEGDDPRLTAFVDKVRSEHQIAADDAMSTLRWILIRPSGRRPVLSRVSAGYRREGEEGWRHFPIRPLAPLQRSLDMVPVTAAWLAAVETALVEDRAEPLAHELLREAEDAMSDSPRSATVTMMAALETGLKQQRRRIDASRAAGRLPPRVAQPGTFRPFSGHIDGDIGDLIRRVGKLEPRRWVTIPEPIADRLDQGRLSRNAIVHEGRPAPERAGLLKLRRAVQDVLYMLDYQAGEEWAKQYIAFDDDADVLYGRPVFSAQFRPG